MISEILERYIIPIFMSIVLILASILLVRIVVFAFFGV